MAGDESTEAPNRYNKRIDSQPSERGFSAIQNILHKWGGKLGEKMDKKSCRRGELWRAILYYFRRIELASKF